MTAQFILQELHSVANEEKARFLQRFFKTGQGQYAAGDLFLGITVPLTRNIIAHCPPLPFAEIQTLLDSPFHEARLAGWLLLVKQYRKAKAAAVRKEIFTFYLQNARRANNWDLVDMSCRDIVGSYLLENPGERGTLYHLAASDNLWEQRIAIVSTWTLIKYGQYADTLALSIQLLGHKHDLIHKAIGWMLREVGKRDRPTLVAFLEEHRQSMPRTALRYAIEHFPPAERGYFMRK